MTELIFEKDIDEEKLQIVTQLFDSWNIRFKLKQDKKKQKTTPVSFLEGAGIWSETSVDSKILREKAWKRGK